MLRFFIIPIGIFCFIIIVVFIRCIKSGKAELIHYMGLIIFLILFYMLWLRYEEINDKIMGRDEKTCTG